MRTPLATTLCAAAILLSGNPAASAAALQVFNPPPGLGQFSDLLDIVTYMANGNIATEDRCTGGEPANNATLETTCAKGPILVALGYFPNLAAGNTVQHALVLIGGDDPPGTISDQLIVTASRPVGANMISVAFELRSDPNGVLPDQSGAPLQDLGGIPETGVPQDITDIALNPATAGQFTAARVWIASDVPEPSPYLLIGAGLLGICASIGRGKPRRPV